LQTTPYYDADAPGLEQGEEGRYRLGFSYQAAGLVPENPSAPEAAEMALDRMWEVTSGTVSVLARLFEQEQREQVSGVVGISTVGNQAVGLGATEALTLLALVSLSLAIVNLIPLLPLDGGHIFWSLVEKVRGRRVPFSVMERASAIGMLLFLFLFFIGLTNDIERLSNDEFNLNR
jgi:regulator of sigma E protease